MLCVVAIVTVENQRAGNLLVSELAMRPFPTGNQRKSHSLQFGDQLANLGRHTRDIATQRLSCQRHLRAAASPRLVAAETRRQRRARQVHPRALRKLGWRSIVVW